MIGKIVVQLMRTDVIGNPTLPSICPKNCRISPLGIQVTLNMIVGQGSRKDQPNPSSSHLSITHAVKNPHNQCQILQYNPPLIIGILTTRNHLWESACWKHSSTELVLIFAGTQEYIQQMKKGGPALRKELGDIIYLEAHPEVCQFFKDVGCYKFCEKIQGLHQ